MSAPLTDESYPLMWNIQRLKPPLLLQSPPKAVLIFPARAGGFCIISDDFNRAVVECKAVRLTELQSN